MQPKESQYFRDNQVYAISSSLLLATSYVPLAYIVQYPEGPIEEQEAIDFLYKSAAGEYFLVNDDATPPVQVLLLEGARYWFKKLPSKKVTETEAFGE